MSDCCITYGKHTYGEINVIGRRFKNFKVTVGKFCSIASDVSVIGVGHNLDWVTTYPFPDYDFRHKWPEAKKIEGHPKVYGDVIIEDAVWIGHGVKILGGVKIGAGAAIATGSIVTCNVKPYRLVGGNPAQTLKRLFEQDVIEKLLKIKWWNWPDEKIKENVKLLCSNNIHDFLAMHYSEDL